MSVFALPLCFDEAPNIFPYCLQLKSIHRLATSKRASFDRFGPYPLSKGSGRIQLPLTHVVLNRHPWPNGCTLFPVEVSYSFGTLFGPSALFSHALHCPFVEMDASRQRAMVRKSVATRKQQGRSLSLASKVGAKVVLERKSDTKDDCPPKKGTSLSVRDKQWKSSLPPPFPPLLSWSREGPNDEKGSRCPRSCLKASYT